MAVEKLQSCFPTQNAVSFQSKKSNPIRSKNTSPPSFFKICPTKKCGKKYPKKIQTQNTKQKMHKNKKMGV